MKKKLIAALLTAGMVLAMTGCGEEGVQNAATSDVKESSNEVSQESSASEEKLPEPKDPVTLTYFYKNGVGEQEYTKQVEEKLHEILEGIEGYEHIYIDLVPCKDNATDLTLAQAEGAQIDMLSLYGLDYSTLIANGDLMELDDLLAANPNVVSELPEWLVDYGKVDGNQYYIPTYQQATSMNFIQIPVDYLEMYYAATGKTEADIYKVFNSCDVNTICDFFEDLVFAVRDATGKETKWLQPFPSNPVPYLFNSETISGNLIIREGGVPEYSRITDYYKTLMGRLAEWYQEGLIHSDFQTYDARVYNGNNMLNDEALVFNWASGAVPEEYFEDFEIEMKAFAMRDHVYIGSQYSAKGNAIYVDSEYPEEAMMIIELLSTVKGKEFYNTLVWGLEGIHWEWEDKSNERIKTLEYDGSQGGSTSTYHAYKWNVGNSFNAWKNQAVKDGNNEYIVEKLHEAETTVISPLVGITWDLSSLADKVSQCKAVDSEYSPQSIIAADDWEARYNEYLKKIDAAGVQDLIDAVTQQYNDFLEAK